MSDEHPVEMQGLRVLAHPLRLRLLSLLTGRSLSGSEAARELGESQANVSYHLRRLLAAGLVSPVAEPEARGRTRRYRHDPASGERLSTEQSADFRLLAAALAAELQRRAFEHRAGPAAFTDADLWVDRGTWSRALDAVRAAGVDLHEHALPAQTSGAVKVSATIALFELEGDGSRTAPAGDRGAK